MTFAFPNHEPPNTQWMILHSYLMPLPLKRSSLHVEGGLKTDEGDPAGNVNMFAKRIFYSYTLFLSRSSWKEGLPAYRIERPVAGWVSNSQPDGTTSDWPIMLEGWTDPSGSSDVLLQRTP